jgi:hypothetical protein
MLFSFLIRPAGSSSGAGRPPAAPRAAAPPASARYMTTQDLEIVRQNLVSRMAYADVMTVRKPQQPDTQERLSEEQQQQQQQQEREEEQQQRTGKGRVAAGGHGAPRGFTGRSPRSQCGGCVHGVLRGRTRGGRNRPHGSFSARGASPTHSPGLLARNHAAPQLPERLRAGGARSDAPLPPLQPPSPALQNPTTPLKGGRCSPTTSHRSSFGRACARRANATR